MNQKNIFSIIGVILVLQGIAFYMMSGKIVSDAFPNLDEMGKTAAIPLMEVVAMLSIALGLIAYAARTSPQVLWAFTVGTVFLCVITLKHLLVDHINVPIPAVIIQIGIVLSSAYLWMQNRNPQA